jgi:hypothetical protein
MRIATNILAVLSGIMCMIALAMISSDSPPYGHSTQIAVEEGKIELAVPDGSGFDRYGGIPVSAVAMITGVLLTKRLVQRVRRRRQLLAWRTRGCCLQCGYDVRASKNICPECGAAIPLRVDRDECVRQLEEMQESSNRQRRTA